MRDHILLYITRKRGNAQRDVRHTLSYTDADFVATCENFDTFATGVG